MKRFTLLKTMLLLCALIVGSGSAWGVDKWVKTAPADLQTGDIVVIVDQATSKAMSNNNGTSSAPSAVAVTLNGDKSEISSEVASTIQWSLTTSGTGAGKTFKFGVSTNYLYVTKTNNGVKVGSGDRNTFTIVTGGDNNGYYLFNSAVINKETDNRNVGMRSSSSDWRCYTSINSDIKGNNNAFYKKTTASGPVDPSVAIDNPTIIVGGTATISGPDGLSISYSGYNDAIVSVSDAGVVTGLAVGSTTITATWAAVADTYKAGSKNIAVNVVNATIYEKVTNANQLVAGNEYILVATGNNKAMGVQNSSIRKSVNVTISEDKVSITDEEVAILTLGGSSSGWTFLASDNDKYLALTSASNAIHASTDASANGSKWTITNDFQLTNVGYDDRVLKYNSGDPRFACYTSGQQTAVLFVKAGSDVSTTVSIASACTDGEKYYGTYSNDKAFRVPEDLTVSAIGISDGKLVVTDYTAGDVVKANTGVMISSTKAGTHNLILTESDGTEISGNCLKASGNTGIDADGMSTAAPDCKYYRLTMHNPATDNKIGFWWGAPDGAAFDVVANKAYLAVPVAAARSGFNLFGDDDTTGIEELKNSKTEELKSYYNLNGQRIANPSKGLYIVNGKKVIIK